MAVNSSQITSPGSDLPILFSAWVQMGIPMRMNGINKIPMVEKLSWVDQDKSNTITRPAKLPKVPGAGHFFPIGPRVAKNSILFASIGYSSRKYFQYFTR
jgi:hypothetical protein